VACRGESSMFPPVRETKPIHVSFVKAMALMSATDDAKGTISALIAPIPAFVE
jgi:hypothetical protein